MGTPILRCRHCGHWYTVNRVVPNICPQCEQSAQWTTETSEAKSSGCMFTEADKRFLAAIKIKATETDA